MAIEPSSDAGFEPADALCIQLPVRLSAVCLSASTLDAVHPIVSKLITVIRLKRGEPGTSWPGACFFWTSPVRRRISLQLTYWDPALQTPAPNDRFMLLLFV